MICEELGKGQTNMIHILYEKIIVKEKNNGH